ncbi:MAG: amino acid ABC transporter permease [Chloroflexota bacterium]
MNQFQFIVDNFVYLLIGFPGQRPAGLIMSVLLAAVAITFGFCLSHLIASGYRSKRYPIRWSSRLYVEIFRGLPLLLLVLLLYQILGHPRLGLNLSAIGSALVALTLYSSAYQAEITRAGIEGMPTQLYDTARVLRANVWQNLLYVRLPYVSRTMLPAYIGQAISLFKDTSVVLIIGVADLMMVARVVLGSDVNNAPYWVALYGAVGFLYFVVAFSLSRFAYRLEKKYRIPDLLHSSISQ